MEVPYQDRIRNDSPDCERSFDPQSVVEGKVVDDPMLVPDVCEVLELFPDQDAQRLLEIYVDCGRSKEILVETIMASK